MGDLETLEVIETFCFFSNDIENKLYELSTLSVLTIGPVVTNTGLTEDEVVGSKDWTESFSSDEVYGSWHKVHEDSRWDISTTNGLVVMNVDSQELVIRVFFKQIFINLFNILTQADFFLKFLGCLWLFWSLFIVHYLKPNNFIENEPSNLKFTIFFLDIESTNQNAGFRFLLDFRFSY